MEHVANFLHTVNQYCAWDISMILQHDYGYLKDSINMMAVKYYIGLSVILVYVIFYILTNIPNSSPEKGILCVVHIS